MQELTPPSSQIIQVNKKGKKDAGEQGSLGLFSPGAIIQGPVAQLAPGEAAQRYKSL